MAHLLDAKFAPAVRAMVLHAMQHDAKKRFHLGPRFDPAAAAARGRLDNLPEEDLLKLQRMAGRLIERAVQSRLPLAADCVLFVWATSVAVEFKVHSHFRLTFEGGVMSAEDVAKIERSTSAG